MPYEDWTAVVAVAQNGVIGRDGQLPWRLKSDLQRFKRMTMGHCLVMGRTTYQSIGKPLPGRQTIVLSRSGFSSPGITVVSNLDELKSAVEPGRKVMIVGGSQVYAQALDRCRWLWLTRVLADVVGDAVMPKVDWSQWNLEHRESIPEGPNDQFATAFEVWGRLPSAMRWV